MDSNGSLKGWPLGQPEIQAKYNALLQRDTERKLANANLRNQGLGYDHMLQQIPINLSRSRSIREAYSRARSLQRLLRRAGLKDTTGKGSQSVPITSPASSVSPRLQRRRNDAVSPLEENALAIISVSSRSPNVVMVTPSPTEIRSSPGNIENSSARKSKKPSPTKFLAKQFKMISISPNSNPRRNIRILGKTSISGEEASFAACGAKVICAAEEVEREQLRELIRMQRCDTDSFADILTPQESPMALRLDSLSRSPGPLMPRRMGLSSLHCTDSQGNSPSSVISEIISDDSGLSVPETIMSSVDNFDESGSKTFTSRASFSKRRDRWTSQELFGSLDFEGELDIMGTIAEGRNVTYSEHVETPDPNSDKFHSYSLEALNYSLAEKVNIPSSESDSDSYSPCQFTSDSSDGWVTDHDQHTLRGRGEQRDVGTRRMKVTSPSSLFRDGPCYSFEKPCQDRPVTNIHRKLTRKLSTSFNKRRKQQGMVHSQLRTIECKHSGLSTRNIPVNKANDTTSSRDGYGNQNTLKIASLLSEFRAVQTQKVGGAGHRKKSGDAAVSQKEAVTVFQDEVAQLMIEGGDIADVEEFLDGFMRLKSPLYLEIVEEFFRAMSYDCYKKPLEVKMAPKVSRH